MRLNYFQFLLGVSSGQTVRFVICSKIKPRFQVETLNNCGSNINELKLYGETHDSKYPYTNVNSQFDLIDWLWNIHRGFIVERPKKLNDIKD